MENSTVSAMMAVARTPAPIPLNHPLVVFARDIYVWLVPVMVTVLSLSVIGNGLIVLSAPFMGKHVSPYHRLCVSLAAADAWAGSLMIAGLMVNSYIPVVLQIRKKNDCITAVLEVFRMAGMLTSNLHILALALNQFIGIVYPLKYKTMLTTRRLRTLIIFLWILPVFFVAPWFFAFENDGFRNAHCRHTFYARLPFRLTVFVAFIVPLFMTFVFYGWIVRSLLIAKVKSSHNMRRSIRNSDRRRVKSRLKLMWTTLLILSTFTLSWGACVLYFVLVCADGCAFVYMRTLGFRAGFFWSSTVNFLVALKLLFNPLIYALRLSHIRSSVIDFSRIILLSRLPRGVVKQSKSECGGLSRTNSATSLHCSTSTVRLHKTSGADLSHLVDRPIIRGRSSRRLMDENPSTCD